eukprot:TRINITY_DN901_c0_g1_i4.p1 TRINITY_DN901_c0_g1~~TRINITY_DN901_c0_g1_i4.p1  ORF type:complete len:561 (-),score=108.79 TRINITY_DN901_c0_g1_i4:1394-3076(-)
MASRVGHFLLFDTLGTGTFAKVKRAVDEKTGEEVAVKVMEKESIASMHMTSNVRREIAIMKALSHENIVRLRQVLASPQRLYLVMDYVQGGELFTKIHRDGALTEDAGRHYFRQLVAGVAYCHSRGVVHRDLKPENLLLDSRTSHLKIADFGLSGLSQMAAGVEGEQLLHTQCGSPNYCAPEILAPASSRAGYNGALVDTWSVGVILYVLLAGRLPFYDPDPSKLYEAISHAPVQFPPNFPEGAADIVRKLLVKEPAGRMSLEEVQKHPWFLVGYEPAVRRRHRRPNRNQAPVADAGSSGSMDDASTNGGGSSTPVTVDGSEEAVEACPPRSVLPATTPSSNARRLVDEDAPGRPAPDEAASGRRSKKPPRPTGTTDAAEAVSSVVGRNGSGEHALQAKRSSSSDGLLGTAGSENGDVEDDGSSSGDLATGQAPRRHTGDAVPPLDVNFLNETMRADDRGLLVPSPGATSSPGGQSGANGAPPRQPIGRTLSDETGGFTAVTRLAGRPPSPPGGGSGQYPRRTLAPRAGRSSPLSTTRTWTERLTSSSFTTSKCRSRRRR